MTEIMKAESIFPQTLFHLLILTISSANEIITANVEMDEYCETEMFTADCGEGEVVLMEQARYGRMKFGRCVDRDYGYVGCSADVRNITDRWCSGRRTCTIPVPNSAFRSTNPCPKDLKPFFGASYSCLRVETNGGRPCQEGYAKAKLPSGYLSKALEVDKGYGSADCPWLVEARPGQRISFSLYDFGHGSWKHTNMVSDTGVCHVTAIIREKGNGDERGATVCGGVGRRRLVYTSSSHAVEVRVMGSSQGFFLLGYQVIGCPDIHPPHNGWAKRRGDVTDVGCNGSGRVWRLQCKDDAWQGASDNCTEGGSTSSGSPGTTIGQVVLGSLLMPFETSIVIIVAIALAIGVIILSFGLICLRWRLNKRAQRRREAAAKSTQLNGLHHDKAPRTADGGPADDTDDPLATAPEGDTSASGENEYAYIADMPPPPYPTNVGNGLDHTKDLRQMTSGVYPVGAYERAAAARVTKDPRSSRQMANGAMPGSPASSPRPFTTFGHRRNESFDYNGNDSVHESPSHVRREGSVHSSPLHNNHLHSSPLHGSPLHGSPLHSPLHGGHGRSDSLGGGRPGPRLLAHECALNAPREPSPYNFRKAKTRSRQSGDGMPDAPTYFEVDPERERQYHVAAAPPPAHVHVKVTSDPRQPVGMTLPNGGVPKNSYVFVDKAAAKLAAGKNTL